MVARYHILIPCLLVAAYAAPLIGALLPNISDELTESYEPVKTITFVYTRGTAFHKWGPLPSMLYAPLYAPFLGYWYATHEFTRPTGNFLSAFQRPFEQVGMLILAARCLALLVAILAVGLYSRALASATRSGIAAVLAMVLCVATAPDLINSFATTKPDGLMLSFLMLSMVVYSRIVMEGFTLRRGIVLSLTAVASISCKEQTAPAYVAMYAWLLLSEGFSSRRFLKDYGWTVLAGVGAYLAVNVVYAPSAWLEHIRYWTSGPGKNPEVWATADYSWAAYLKDVGAGILFNLGPGGSAMLLAALGMSMVFRSKKMAAAWAPLVGYLVLLIATAGYMPRYFLLPVTILAALPVGLVLARVRLRGVNVAFVVALSVANLWAGNMAWAQARQLAPWMVEEYASKVGKEQTVNFAYPWKVRPGSSRLTYLGYKVDDRELGQLMEHPADGPQFLLLTRAWENWLLDFKNRPARNKMYEAGGYSYAKFGGMKELGYELVETVHPRMPFFLEPGWFPWPFYKLSAESDLLVYRKTP